MKSFGCSFVRTGNSRGQGHATETLGDIHVSERKFEAFSRRKGRRRSSKKNTSAKSAGPKLLRAFIQIVYNENLDKHHVKISVGAPSVLRPCEKLIEELTHETVGKPPRALLSEAQEIGGKRLKEILVLA